MFTPLINEHLINLDLKATRKEEVFTEMARLLASQGKVSNEQAFIKDLWAREELGNTGFEEGVALPHAKSAAVCNPAVAIGISRNELINQMILFALANMDDPGKQMDPPL